MEWKYSRACALTVEVPAGRSTAKSYTVRGRDGAIQRIHVGPRRAGPPISRTSERGGTVAVHMTLLERGQG